MKYEKKITSLVRKRLDDMGLDFVEDITRYDLHLDQLHHVFHFGDSTTYTEIFSNLAYAELNSDEGIESYVQGLFSLGVFKKIEEIQSDINMAILCARDENPMIREFCKRKIKNYRKKA